MTLTLTTWERLMCTAIVGALTGTAADIRAAGKVLDILEIRPDQAQLIGLRQDANGSLDWQDKDTTWILDFDDKGLALIKRAVEAHGGWAARDTKRVDALIEKLAVQP